MKHNMIIRCFLVVFVIMFAFIAEVSASINVKIWAGKDGLTVKYNIPAIGSGNIDLENEGDTETIKIRLLMVKIAELEITLNDITSDPDFVNIHYMVHFQHTSETEPVEDIEGDLSIPFGDFGIEINLNSKKMSRPGDSAVDGSLLLTKDSTQYDININFVLDLFGMELDFTQNLEGTATPEDNLIHEEIENPIDESILFDVDVEVEYPSKMITVFNYNISPSVPEGLDNETDNKTPAGFEGSIKLPNGSYHGWLDMDFGAYMPGIPE